jgi:hypothetical protein
MKASANKWRQRSLVCERNSVRTLTGSKPIYLFARRLHSTCPTSQNPPYKPFFPTSFGQATPCSMSVLTSDRLLRFYLARLARAASSFPLLNANIIKNAQFNCFVVPLAVFTHSHKLLQIAEFGAASKLAPVGDYPVGTILRDDFCAQIDLWPSSSKWISKAASMTRCSEQNTSSKKAPDICSGAYGRRRSRNQSSHTRGILAHVRIYLFRSSIIKRLQSPTASSQHRRNPIRETRAYQICDAATTCAADYSDVLACHVLSRCHGATCGNQTTAC